MKNDYNTQPPQNLSWLADQGAMECDKDEFGNSIPAKKEPEKSDYERLLEYLYGYSFNSARDDRFRVVLGDLGNALGHEFPHAKHEIEEGLRDGRTQRRNPGSLNPAATLSLSVTPQPDPKIFDIGTFEITETLDHVPERAPSGWIAKQDALEFCNDQRITLDEIDGKEITFDLLGGAAIQRTITRLVGSTVYFLPLGEP